MVPFNPIEPVLPLADLMVGNQVCFQHLHVFLDNMHKSISLS